MKHRSSSLAPHRSSSRDRSSLVLAALSSLVALAACRHTPPGAEPVTMPAPAVADMPDVSPRAMRVYRAALVVDMHDDMPTKMLDDHYDPDVRHAPGFGPDAGHTDLPRLLESGITAEFLSAFVDASYAAKRPDESYRRVGLYLDTIAGFAIRHPDKLIFARTAADVRRAKAEGKVAIFIGVEGGHAIESSLDRLDDL